ncbi:hypothetical protein LX15_004333 [Streptoalloteichus tenebrarius]|uniref:Uncharacterized protein n=2 Tax=Streptoalloteichus tenebrarius (strain ATCC 17920 / DSM 40477 / JCM 4838 / CBS 697.72 / NBRC 16177 / NCIMB 11028 / NRRL B-12390 / A12253. 1 / ISP 5477) TaxID=1933 RepID=A0ABT1HYL8_STRSD|nr:hypothetical protein [Streptoalloteichus tenebrarius]
MRVYQANSARNVADLLGYQPPPGRMAVGDHAPSGPFDGGSGTPAIVSAAFGASSVGGEADQPDGAGRLAGGGGRPSEIRTPDSGGGGDASVVGGALTAPDQVMSSESVSGEPGVVAGVGIGGVGDAVAGDRPEGRLEGRSAEFGGSSVGGEADQPGGADRLAGGGGWPTEVRTRDSGGGEATGVDDAAEVPGLAFPVPGAPTSPGHAGLPAPIAPGEVASSDAVWGEAGPAVGGWASGGDFGAVGIGGVGDAVPDDHPQGRSAEFAGSSGGGEAAPPADGPNRPSEIRIRDSGGVGGTKVGGGAVVFSLARSASDDPALSSLAGLPPTPVSPGQLASSESASGEPGALAGGSVAAGDRASGGGFGAVGTDGVGDAVSDGRAGAGSAEFGSPSVGGEADQLDWADRPSEIRTRDSGGGGDAGVDDAAEVPGLAFPVPGAPTSFSLAGLPAPIAPGEVTSSESVRDEPGIAAGVGTGGVGDAVPDDDPQGRSVEFGSWSVGGEADRLADGGDWRAEVWTRGSGGGGDAGVVGGAPAVPGQVVSSESASGEPGALAGGPVTVGGWASGGGFGAVGIGGVGDAVPDDRAGAGSAEFGSSSVGGEAVPPVGGGGQLAEIRTPDSGGGEAASVVGGALTAPDQVMSSASVSGEPGVVAGVGIGGVGDAVPGDRPEGRLEGRSAEFGGSSVGGEADQPDGADRLADGGDWPTEVRTRGSGGGGAAGVEGGADAPGQVSAHRVRSGLGGVPGGQGFLSESAVLRLGRDRLPDLAEAGNLAGEPEMISKPAADPSPRDARR